jgi:hypothetical protein
MQLLGRYEMHVNAFRLFIASPTVRLTPYMQSIRHVRYVWFLLHRLGSLRNTVSYSSLQSFIGCTTVALELFPSVQMEYDTMFSNETRLLLKTKICHLASDSSRMLLSNSGNFPCYASIWNNQVPLYKQPEQLSKLINQSMVAIGTVVS